MFQKPSQPKHVRELSQLRNLQTYEVVIILICCKINNNKQYIAVQTHFLFDVKILHVVQKRIQHE